MTGQAIPQGWKGTSGGMNVDKVVARVLAGRTPGQIGLMHVGANPDDGTTLDAAALPRIIAGLPLARLPLHHPLGTARLDSVQEKTDSADCPSTLPSITSRRQKPRPDTATSVARRFLIQDISLVRPAQSHD